MIISDLIEGLEVLAVQGSIFREVADVAYDSRRCRKGSLFVAVSGLQADGHDFIPEAIRNGAFCVVHEQDVPFEQGITYIRVKNSRRTLGSLGKAFFGNPSARICLIGVTGTNGKTTVTYCLESILKAAGFSVGVIGTVACRFGGKAFASLNTTPESLELQKILRKMVDAGVTHVVMEVSSHALDLKRVDDCEFDIGIFTNLSPEHLDYHYTMEAYFEAKKRFFQEILAGRNLIINYDDSWGRRLAREAGTPSVTYGIESGSDVQGRIESMSLQGSDARVTTSREIFRLSSHLIGRFNLSNILAATAAALTLRLPSNVIQQGIEALQNVPGRLERVGTASAPIVFVDYAHTEDALQRVLENLSEFRTGRIITVFGCGGDRDRSKRPRMGKVAADLSDFVVITSDNPRFEEPAAIIAEIEAGIPAGRLIKYIPAEVRQGNGCQKGYATIIDRKTAIALALANAASSDIVLIAGKGHEDYQVIGADRYPFDDRLVAAEFLVQQGRNSGAA